MDKSFIHSMLYKYTVVGCVHRVLPWARGAPEGVPQQPPGDIASSTGVLLY